MVKTVANKYCWHCGAKLNPGDLFCEECGQLVEDGDDGFASVEIDDGLSSDMKFLELSKNKYASDNTGLKPRKNGPATVPEPVVPAKEETPPVEEVPPAHDEVPPTQVIPPARETPPEEVTTPLHREVPPTQVAQPRHREASPTQVVQPAREVPPTQVVQPVREVPQTLERRHATEARTARSEEVRRGGHAGGPDHGGRSPLSYVLVALVTALVVIGGTMAVQGRLPLPFLGGGEQQPVTEEVPPADDELQEQTQAVADAGSASKQDEDDAIERIREMVKEEEQQSVETTPQEVSTTEAPAPAKEEAPTARISIPGTDGTVRDETIRLDGTSERIFGDSNSRVLSADEIRVLSDAELCIAWNEIIAVKGYVFKNEGLRAYFSGCSWYHPDPQAAGDLSGLSEAARTNVENLQAALRDSWWRERLT